MSAPAFAVVSEFEVGFLKFQGRRPRTLAEKAVARADYEHAVRLAEIKKMTPKLVQLEALLPVLAAGGVNLAERTITTLDSGKTLRIQSSIFQPDDKLHGLLLAQGFREVERMTWGSREDQVILKHGRSLLVRIDVSKPAAPAPATEAATSGAPA